MKTALFSVGSMKLYLTNLKKRLIVFGISVVLLLVVFLALSKYGVIGTMSGQIEKDARFSQRVDASWSVSMETSEVVSAMVFYPDHLIDYIYSIYVNRSGFSFGYFFRSGGSTFGIDDSIAEFHIEGFDERAFISMNRPQVSKVEIDDGNSLRMLEIDSEKPFAIVLPVHVGGVIFYDINGNAVDRIRVV